MISIAFVNLVCSLRVFRRGAGGFHEPFPCPSNGVGGLVACVSSTATVDGGEPAGNRVSGPWSSPGHCSAAEITFLLIKQTAQQAVISRLLLNAPVSPGSRVVGSERERERCCSLDSQKLVPSPQPLADRRLSPSWAFAGRKSPFCASWETRELSTLPSCQCAALHAPLTALTLHRGPACVPLRPWTCSQTLGQAPELIPAVGGCAGG